MRLESVLFGARLDAISERYCRMAGVLLASATENSPATPLTVTLIREPDDDIRALARPGCKQKWIDNARKAKWHNEIIQQAADGEVLCMLDADTMVLGDLSDVEALEFDIAYTVRPPECRWKINTGVYFVRVSPLARAFCENWFKTVKLMLEDADTHEHYRKRRSYGGIHQAALGSYLDNKLLTIKLLPLPCETWNSVSKCWEIPGTPKVVHIMGQMRDWCLGPDQCFDANARRWVERWQAYDRQASPAMEASA